MFSIPFLRNGMWSFYNKKLSILSKERFIVSFNQSMITELMYFDCATRNVDYKIDFSFIRDM